MRARYILLAGSLLAATTASAQTRPDSVVCTGRVLNPASVPLAGASVLLKGTVVATSTNADGVFHLMVPAGPQVLVVSYPRHLAVQYPIPSPDSLVVITLHATQPRVTPPRPRRQ
ncbi:carboxypeptidase regulatory-like domain-containing protein [Hymenobacter perfusus]|uniref:Carboxypeptidase-like regulatory domain-containing protein n=1 Tax=Hymenobacter perfusus TaxID=1236770 RepID=A0A428KIH7_9BACT|nr:carboxypeptidase regulatory-like domain-containing protein [Hymenobacter perfusus]RSK46252.1 carboxypeptidase-like regulatory domain-containing protein [Hymenobacter perfusus]